MSSTPQSTLWALAPHTIGKHRVLQRYLKAWLPILARRNERILFIDGFAGPGEYLNGEKGSPMIALEALSTHRHLTKIESQVIFFFIEENAERAKYLETRIGPIVNELGSQVIAEVRQGTFDGAMTEVLDQIDQQGAKLAPAFVMVDPFGVSDTPMAVLERILKNPKSELYVSFMWEYFNRFKDTDEFDPHLDSLFGTDAWRPLARIPDWRERKRAIFDLYRRELKQRGAKFVLHFELYEGATLKYAIFFATKSDLGCDRMKEAIWKVDPFAGHAFVPAADDTLQLFSSVDVTPLKAQLRVRYGALGATLVQTMEAWMRTDETFYHSGQLRKALRELETENHLVVVPGTRKKAKTFPDGTKITLTPL